MQTLFKGSKLSTKNFISGGKKLGSSIVGAAKNNIVGFNKVAKSIIPQKKEEKENNFIKNYTNFFGSKKTEKILRKNLKLVRDSLVNTFEIARHLKAAIISITGDLKGKGGKGGGGGLLGGILKSFLSGLFGGALLAALPILLKIAAVGITAFAIWVLSKKKVRDAIADFMTPIIQAIAKAIYKNTTFRGWWGDGDFGSWGRRVNESVEDIGEARTLAVLKEEQKRLAALHEENKGFLGGSEYKKDLNAVTKQIKRLESKGFVASTDSATTMQDLKAFQERGDTRDSLQSSMDMELEAVRTATFNEMIKQLPEELRDKTGFKLNDQGIVVPDLSANFRRFGIDWKARNLKDEKARAQQSRILNWVQDFTTEAGKRQNVIRNKYDNKVSGNDLGSLLGNEKQNVEGVKSDINSLDFDELFNNLSDVNSFNLQPFTFDLSQKQDSSGGITNTSGGTTSSGNAVTFFSSSNSDPTYHKLNALMTFNII